MNYRVSDDNTNNNNITTSNNPINDYITLYSPIDFKTFKYDNSINNTVIKQALWIAENTHLKSILGKTLFDDFIVEFKLANGNPKILTTGINTIKGINYKDLWEEARMYVIEEAAKLLAFELTYSLSQSGVKQQIQDSTFVTITSDFKSYMLHQQSTIDYYKSVLINYINNTIKKDTTCTNPQVSTWINPIYSKKINKNV